MRLTSVDMFQANIEEPITFSLRREDPKAQYVARSILGLDAQDIIQKFYGTGLSDSDRFYEFGLKPREIVMRIVLNPKFILGESYSDVRDDLYRAISSNRTGGVKLHFMAGATVVSGIFGYISKFEVAYFDKFPEVQITVKCDDPMFRAINPVIYGPTEISSTNPIIVPDTLSTSPHGFSMELTCTVYSTTFTIQDQAVDPNWKFELAPVDGDLGVGFEVGDVLYISSEFSEKMVLLLRDGDLYTLANAISPTSVWPIVFPFPNQNSFYIPEIASFDWVDISYYAAYWGV